MDKFKAQTEIENIFFLISNQEKSVAWQREELAKVLAELQTYNYNWGKRNGLFKAVNELTKLAEDEKI